jgi:cytoskeletal protein CcmA (bactofilin family)
MSKVERGHKLIAANQSRGYTHAHARSTTGQDADRPRRKPMFKKNEETEWTRFSKALSSRDKETDESEAETTSSPASAAASRSDVAAPGPATTAPRGETSVSPRAPGRTQAALADEDAESIIGEHTTVDGTFKSESSIRVRGSVQGEIESSRSIVVDSQANVNAKVTAQAVTVAGQVDGQIHCAGKVEILPSGRVVGEINAGALVMQEGAFFEGNLKMGGRTSEVAMQGSEKEPVKA